MVTALIALVFVANLLLANSRLCCRKNRKIAVVLTSGSNHSRNPRFLYRGEFLLDGERDTAGHFVLLGDKTAENVLRIQQIQYKNGSNSINCSNKIIRSVIHLTLEELIPPEYLLGIINPEQHDPFKDFCRLSSFVDLVATLSGCSCSPSHDDYDPEQSWFNHLFLVVCVVVICGTSAGWFVFVYFRRYRQQRMKKKQAKALERSVQKMLEKMPVFTFDSKTKEEHFLDNDDPMCSICLESFKDNDKLRKLICAHYFHANCVDPWLLTHQKCPLCNQNILNEPIPTISGRFSVLGNPRSNSRDSSIAVRN